MIMRPPPKKGALLRISVLTAYTYTIFRAETLRKQAPPGRQLNAKK